MALCQLYASSHQGFVSSPPPLQVDTTFAAALAEPGEAELRDKSFTSAVRVFAPNGGHVG